MKIHQHITELFLLINKPYTQVIHNNGQWCYILLAGHVEQANTESAMVKKMTTVQRFSSNDAISSLCAVMSIWFALCLNSNKHNKWSKNFQKRLHHSGDFSLGKYNITLDCFCSRPTGILVNSMWRNPDGIPSLKSAPSRGGCGPHLIYSSLGLPESTSQIASQSVQQFLQGSQSPQTNWPNRLCYSVHSNRPHLPSAVMWIIIAKITIIIPLNDHFYRWTWVTQFPWFHLRSLYSICSATEPLGTSATGFFYRPDVLPVTQPSVTKHWREKIALTLTSGLDLFFLLPSLTSDGRGDAPFMLALLSQCQRRQQY